ncbi:hypothetical protein L3Q82_003229 [Scortum barcoo]|uniref:Uncharacterized protein n=1 Tax=Scortum barcoo TaxID=214431 RepID=A0ACB8VRQ8_9TELE|nr:hypothetical protein L3Q82_003229 [Scortum barcoo]
MAKVREAETRPPLNKTRKFKHHDWAKKYLKTDFSKVLWTDEMRVTLDGPDGWPVAESAMMSTLTQTPARWRWVLVWAGIIKDELVGPFQVEDGLRLNSQTYCQFLEDTFSQSYKEKSASFKKTMIFMQDKAPSQASKYSTVFLASKGLKDERIMTWPPSSPDLNPVRELVGPSLNERCTVKENTSLNSVWEAVVAAAQKVDGQVIKKLTDSMDGRLECY